MIIEREKMEEQVEIVGRAFVDHYYHLFDNDRAALSSLFQPTSMLTFESHKIVGVDNISSKLNQLPLDQSKHLISTIDSKPPPPWVALWTLSVATFSFLEMIPSKI